MSQARGYDSRRGGTKWRTFEVTTRFATRDGAVRKLVLEENGGTPLMDPKIRKARAKLFDAWEMNWPAYN